MNITSWTSTDCGMYSIIAASNDALGKTLTTCLTRNATVDVVLWDDTRIVPCDSKVCANSAHGIACARTTEYATMAGKFA